MLARGNWLAGKWNLEIRRNLTTVDSLSAGLPPRLDDVQLVAGRHYKVRVTVYDASSTKGSQSILLPFYLKPQ